MSAVMAGRRAQAAAEKSMPRQMEMVVADVAGASADAFAQFIDDLMSDGVPFGGEKLSEQEQLKIYLGQRPGADGQPGPNYHTDPSACGERIAQKVQQLTETLTALGVPPEAIASCHPFEISLIGNLKWSARMEAALVRSNEKARAAQPEPSFDGEVPFVPEGMTGMTEDGEPGS